MTGNKKFLTLATTLIAAVSVGVGVVVINGVNNNASFFAKADLSYSVNLNSSNGAVSSEGQVLKTRSVVAKTNLNNDVSVYFKNAQNTAGKVGTIKAKGFYGNKNPIYDMVNIRVTSNATESGDATLYYGPTSAYMPYSTPLSTAASGVDVSGKSANYFKIVANKEVIVESIGINFGCATKDFGPIALNAEGNPLPTAYKFTFDTDHYYMSRNSGYASAKTIIVPDYYDDGVNGEHPVTVLGDGSSTGCFEGNSSLTNLYIPETVTKFDRYLFYTSNQMTEFTIPYSVTLSDSYPVPKTSLEVLNINSQNLTASNTAISTSNTPNLKTVNVSYDVEKLPSIVSSWPADVTINYEGTEAEWASLKNVAGTAYAWTSDFTGNVICSDTALATVTLSYAGATLNTVQNETVVTKVVGKTLDNPGTPVYDDGTKQFKGWFDAATGGNAIVFPMTVTEDTTIYAHFEDYGPGARFDNPINVVLGNSYSFTTDAQAPVGYFAYTATADAIIQMELTAADASFSTINLRAFDNLGERATIQTNYSASSAVAKYFSPDPDDGVGSFLRIRVANGETVYCGVDGIAYSSTYYGAFTVEFSEVTAAGDDYTTAIAVTDSATFTPADGKLTWYKFTPETTTDYYMTLTATTQWTGGSIGTVSGSTWTNVVASFNASAGATKRAIQTLTAGTTYYFCINGRGGEVTLAVSDEVAESYSRSSAKALTIDGEAIAITYDSDFATRWYKFTVADTGKYRLTSSINITSSVFKLFKEGSDTEIAFSAGRTGKDKVYDFSGEGLGAATYYLSVVTTSSNSGLTIKVDTVQAEAVVTVYANGPDAAYTSRETIDAGNTYTLANPTYVSNGHTYYDGFVGWFTDAELTVPFVSDSTIINEDTSIYAKLTGKYQSNFLNNLNDDYGEFIENATQTDTYKFIQDGEDIISTNDGIASSYSSFTIELKKAATVRFEYFVTSESASSDYFAVYTYANIDSSYVNVLKDGGTSMTEYQSKLFLLNAGNMIRFEYRKDSGLDKGIDKVKIKNLVFEDVVSYDLTCVLNNGEGNQVLNVVENQPITMPTPEKEGFVLGGWYEDPDFTVKFNPNAGISADKIVYAKWIDHALQRGTYTGYNLYSSSSTPGAPYSITANLTISDAGAISGTKTGQVTDLENDGANTYISNSGASIYFYYNDAAGIIWTQYGNSASTSVGTDTYIFFKDVKAVSHLRYGSAISGSAYTALLKVTRNDDSVIYVLCYNNVVYDNVTWTAELDFADLTTSTAMTVKDKLGNDIFTKA